MRICRMFPITRLKATFRSRRLLLLPMLVAICAGLLVYAKPPRPLPYAFAADLPRGPIVYAQFNDLPALFHQWNDSKLKERYLASTNFTQFQDRHLATKIVERWD